MLLLEKFSLGVGDRFAHQASAQLDACQKLAAQGVVVVPVWNKSNREHLLIGSEPPTVKAAALAAIQSANWKHGWHVDADHIRLETVDRFLDSSDFFTIDVAESIGAKPNENDVDAFVKRHPELHCDLNIPGISRPISSSIEGVRKTAMKYLSAVQEAGRIYRHIEKHQGAGNFIAEVSMDETDLPQTPAELLIILSALADEKIPLQTIAPKFTGRFNKGVDYVGDLKTFTQEFHEDLAVIKHSISAYGLPANLKLSVHSGSDKFSIYPIIREALLSTGAGLHVKTAGTTWLEEMIGLAEAGGDGLELVKEIYAMAMAQQSELCAPYATVIDIRPETLPSVAETNSWSSEQFVRAIRHNQSDPQFNHSLRQLLHVSFKLAAKKGSRYLGLLKSHQGIVAKNVTENLYVRHLVPLFSGLK